MRTIIAALFACCTLCATAQPKPVERVYLQTDKEMYVAGELMWFHAVTTDRSGVPQELSRICYIELLNGGSPVMQVMAPVENASGEGAVLLPGTITTGTYRLVAYTKYMENGPQETFFRKNIVVINPLEADFMPEVGSESVQAPAYWGNIKPSVNIGRTSYSGRENVEVALSGLPADTEFLSVSVTGCDFAGGFAQPHLAVWREGLRKNENAAMRNSILAEYEGHIVTGQITDAATGQPTAANIPLTPLLSFPGRHLSLFTGTMGEEGRIRFLTRHTAGFPEAATSFREEPGVENYRIDLLKPYFEGHGSLKGTNPIPASGYSRQRVLEQNLATQVQYSYVKDSLNRFASELPALGRKPDVTYIMKEYTKFATMPEVITEFVTWARFRRVDGRRYLTISSDGSATTPNSLVILDGIPISNHDVIYDYNPLLLERIDIWDSEYMFGGKIYNGLISMTTKEANYPELDPDEFTRIIPYEMPLLPRLFFSPAYDTPEKTASRTPDYRHTLYWNPSVEVEDGNAGISFYTSDLKGEFRITVEGLTAKGEPISTSATFKVE